MTAYRPSPNTVHGDLTLVGGNLATAHDALYVRPKRMSGTATLVEQTAGLNFPARWDFSGAADQLVTFEWEVPVRWEAFAGRLGFIMATSSGGLGVTWRWAHHLLPLGGNPGIPLTVVGEATLTAPVGLGGGWAYGTIADRVDCAGAAVAITTITRLGSTDAETNTAGLVIATMTRQDP